MGITWGKPVNKRLSTGYAYFLPIQKHRRKEETVMLIGKMGGGTLLMG